MMQILPLEFQSRGLKRDIKLCMLKNHLHNLDISDHKQILLYLHRFPSVKSVH